MRQRSSPQTRLPTPGTPYDCILSELTTAFQPIRRDAQLFRLVDAVTLLS